MTEEQKLLREAEKAIEGLLMSLASGFIKQTRMSSGTDYIVSKAQKTLEDVRSYIYK